MSLPRKDVRVWFDPEYHRALKRIADAKNMDMADWLEELAVRVIRDLVHEASVIAESAPELGIARNEPESTGTRRDRQDSTGRPRNDRGPQ